MSATTPAPPEGSRPAIVSTTGLFIEQPYRRHSTGPRVKTFEHVLEVDTADRHHRKPRQCRRDFAKFFESLRRAESALRCSVKHWTKDDEIRASCPCVQSTFNGMRRYPDQKILTAETAHH